MRENECVWGGGGGWRPCSQVQRSWVRGGDRLVWGCQAAPRTGALSQPHHSYLQGEATSLLRYFLSQ